MSGRWRWVAVAVALALVAGVASAYVVTRGGPPAHKASPRPPAPRLLPLAALGTGGSPATSVGVARALAAVLRDPAFGGHLSADVVDGVTGQVLLDSSSLEPMTPASTVKLLTATAALAALGPGSTLSTDVVRNGRTLYLVGGGDVTLRESAAPGAAAYPPTATLDDLARQTAAALGPAVSTGTQPMQLCLDTSAWSGPVMAPGWSSGYFSGGDIAHLSPLEVDEGAAVAHHRARAPIPRVADPAAAAGTAFARALRRAGVEVRGALCRATAPASGLGVATVHSPTMSALVQRMLTLSDNDLAEALGRAVAQHAGRTPDFTGAAAAVLDEVRSLGVDVSGVVLNDASGLSRLDRVSAKALVQLVQLAVAPGRPQLRAVAEGLPVAGLTGTLADRYRRGPALVAAGVARAKTGTLAGVNTIAGYVVDRDGRLLVFAFLTDRAVGPDATEAALDRVVGRLAGCGCG